MMETASSPGHTDAAIELLVAEALNRVEDPEVPVSIVDLGLIEHLTVEGGNVRLSLVPTIVACPGKVAMERAIHLEVGRIPDVRSIEVEWLSDRQWTPERVTPRGRAKMAELGVSSRPVCSLQDVACPYCGSRRTRRKNDYGAAPCHSQWFCEECRSAFDLLRGVLVQITRGVPT